MILFYWAQLIHGVEPEPGGASARIWVNTDLAAKWSIGFGKMEFVLDSLCLWGGADRREICYDGTTTVSWEFPGERYALVKSLLEKWKLGKKDMPVWHEEPFYNQPKKLANNA